MTTFQINVTEAKKKRIPSKNEAAKILTYLKANPSDETAIPKIMDEYNCSELSIMKIIMEDTLKND